MPPYFLFLIMHREYLNNCSLNKKSGQIGFFWLSWSYLFPDAIAKGFFLPLSSAKTTTFIVGSTDRDH